MVQSFPGSVGDATGSVAVCSVTGEIKATKMAIGTVITFVLCCSAFGNLTFGNRCGGDGTCAIGFRTPAGRVQRACEWHRVRYEPCVSELYGIKAMKSEYIEDYY